MMVFFLLGSCPQE